MSQPTPGPWTVSFATGKVCAADGSRHVATMAPTCVTGQWEADARLITQAPALREMLASALNCHAHHESGCDCWHKEARAILKEIEP